jgi:NO-binding membrane sensor protein with MHYT domain
LTFEVSGVPHTATWPRNLALTLAALIMGVGIWGAVFAKSNR